MQVSDTDLQGARKIGGLFETSLLQWKSGGKSGADSSKIGLSF